MKKYFVFFLCLVQLKGFCATNNSDNTFDITISDIPQGGGSNKSGGLSSGAVTAITLGSIFGGLAAAGCGYYFYKRGICITGACVSQKSNPLIPICGCKKNEYIDNNYPQLKRIIENEEICLDCSKKKYIFIKDSHIKNKTFTRFYFKNDNFTRIKIIQYSKPFNTSKNILELNTKIFLEDEEVALSTEKINCKEGILIKKGKLSKDGIYFADTSLVGKGDKNVYAIVIEFDK